MPAPEPIPLEMVRDGERAMRICNACRYCEGFCAVFPALERRLTFSGEDLSYLANLCHDCRECYYSCQYAPPHEFGLNLPRVLGEIRRETHRSFAWPAAAVRIFGRSGPALVVSLLFGPVAFLLGAFLFAEPGTFLAAHTVEEGSFYRVIPHGAMVYGFGLVGAFVLLALAMGFRNFWRGTGGRAGSWLDPSAWLHALRDAATLRYLGGGGGGEDGCAYPDERASSVRRYYHHVTFYGFVACFASTTMAAIYHNVFRWEAPYELSSFPVILGWIGGLGLIVGPLGLLALGAARDPEPSDPLQRRIDAAFLVLLLVTSVTGLLLFLLRETQAMGVMLAVHLGVVLGLFLTMPYGKFVHGMYRLGALVRNAQEERRS